MKKTLLVTAATLAVSALASQAQVYSQNIVGYVNQTFAGGNAFSLIGVPVWGATNTVENIVTAITPGDNIFIWTGGGYTVLSYFGVNWDGNGNNWSDQNGNGVASPTLAPGQAAFYQNGQGNTETNTYVGSVVFTNNITLAGGNAFSLIASTVPISDTLDGTNLALPLQPGDNVFLWTGGGYNVVSYFGVNWDGNGHNWSDQNGNGIAAPVVSVGQGFFYQNGQGANETWVQNFSVQ